MFSTLISTLLVSYLAGTSGFINIPTAGQYDVPGLLGVGFAYSMNMFSDDPDPTDDMEPDPNDYNMFLRYGFLGRGEIAVSMYTTNTYALSIKYTVVKEGRGPALFMGVDNITYAKYISSLGSGDSTGFLEEVGYVTESGGRPPEMMSAYLGIQKTFGKVFNVVLGLGRGRFVGYGERSHIFNTDLFVLGDDYETEDHSGWAFGLFFGASLRFPFGLELMAEMDGRDASVGMKYHNKYVTPVFAITKVEQFGDRRPFSPRIAMGIEATNRFMHERPKSGTLEYVIQDNITKEMLTNSNVRIVELNKQYTASGGTFSLKLPAGNYTIIVSRTDYVDYRAKISVKPNVQSKLVFNMQKTEEARRLEQAAREKDASIRNHLEQGKIYFAEGNLVQAKAAFEMVISLDPGNIEAQESLGALELRRANLIAYHTSEAKRLTQAKNYTQATQSWQRVLALDPDNAEAKNGVAALRKLASAPAKQPAKPARQPAPSTPKVSEAEIEKLYKNGVSLFTSERYDEALNVFKRVLALNPNHVGAKEYKKRTEARLRVLKGSG
ncbi:MAG: tetratricopeptide repeat protein [candidate division WOR-3 bacterium]|nr:MAG: tetratricopeptide repeat protein [candidate division WOR-3 bacterium]